MSAYNALLKYRNKNPIPLQTTALKVRIDGETEEVDLPLYTSDSPKTTTVHLCREFFNMVDTYDLFDAESAPRVYNRFRRCLQGIPRDEWDDTTDGITKTKDAFLVTLKMFLQDIVGDEAHQDQDTYLRQTRKPDDMSIDRWIQQILTYNNNLEYIDGARIGAAMPERSLITLVITPNIPTGGSPISASRKPTRASESRKSSQPSVNWRMERHETVQHENVTNTRAK